jgi:hypothetical protein
MMQASLWDKPGVVSNEHPVTSHVAAATVKAGSQRAQVLGALWGGGMTAYRLAVEGLVLNGADLPVSPNQIATRLKELRDAGYVEYVRDFPGGPFVEEPTTAGNTALVQTLTGYGRRQVAALMAKART